MPIHTPPPSCKSRSFRSRHRLGPCRRWFPRPRSSDRKAVLPCCSRTFPACTWFRRSHPPRTRRMRHCRRTPAPCRTRSPPPPWSECTRAGPCCNHSFRASTSCRKHRSSCTRNHRHPRPLILRPRPLRSLIQPRRRPSHLDLLDPRKHCHRMVPLPLSRCPCCRLWRMTCHRWPRPTTHHLGRVADARWGIRGG